MSGWINRKIGYLSLLLAAFAVFLNSRLQPSLSTSCQSQKIAADLEPQLSPDATIVLSEHTLFKQVSARWDNFAYPNLCAYVEVSTERDVQATVCRMIGHHVQC